MLRALFLDVKRECWRMHDPHSQQADSEFAALRGDIVREADETCCFCKWRAYSQRPRGAPTLIEVHHEDGNHHNNARSNLLASCSLCHAYHHIGFAGAFAGARLIALPEISPATFNVLQRSLWALAAYARLEDEDEANVKRARSTVDEFDQLFTEKLAHLESQLGSGCSAPGILANLLLKCDDSEYRELTAYVDRAGLRLLHSESAYQHETDAAFGSGGIYTSLHPRSWSKLVSNELEATWHSLVRQ